jgi:hypothetical protein
MILNRSALNIFAEYSMTNPGPLAKYIGFTEDDILAFLVHLGYLGFDSERREVFIGAARSQ